MRIPNIALPTENPPVLTVPKLLECWVYVSSSFGWKLVSRPTLGNQLEVKILKDKETQNCRVLISEVSGTRIVQTISNSFVHPDTVLVQRDAKTLAFWVQDHSLSLEDPVEQCLKLYFLTQEEAQSFQTTFSRIRIVVEWI